MVRVRSVVVTIMFLPLLLLIICTGLVGGIPPIQFIDTVFGGYTGIKIIDIIVIVISIIISIIIIIIIIIISTTSIRLGLRLRRCRGRIIQLVFLSPVYILRQLLIR